MKKYYDVHCFFARNNGYSIPVMIETVNDLTDDEVIQHCVDNKLFQEVGDEEYVDSVTEIDETEFNQMKNI